VIVNFILLIQVVLEDGLFLSNILLAALGVETVDLFFFSYYFLRNGK